MKNRNQLLKHVVLTVCNGLCKQSKLNLLPQIFMQVELQLSKVQISKLYDYDKEITEFEYQDIKTKISQYCVSQQTYFDGINDVISKLEFKLDMTYIDTKIYEIMLKHNETDVDDMVTLSGFPHEKVKESLNKLLELNKIKYSDHLQTYFIK